MSAVSPVSALTQCYTMSHTLPVPVCCSRLSVTVSLAWQHPHGAKPKKMGGAQRVLLSPASKARKAAKAMKLRAAAANTAAAATAAYAAGATSRSVKVVASSGAASGAGGGAGAAAASSSSMTDAAKDRTGVSASLKENNG